MEEKMEEKNKKINRTINLYPILYAFTADTILFVPINTLFFTIVKNLNASQISAMTMFGLLVCILSQKIIVKVTKKLGNINSIRVGCFLLLLSSIILTFGKSFISMVLYKITLEYAYMFWIMTNIILRNNLNSLNRKEEYYIVRNKAKVMYAIATMVTALISGYLFNINNYLPLYLSIFIFLIIFLLSFSFYETEYTEEDNKRKKAKVTSSVLFFVILSNALFYSIIKLGQDNSKLFMQYDFGKNLSVEMVTYYITTIVFISRVVRILGNIIFSKTYKRIKDKMSIVLTVLELMAFSLILIGHYINFNFTLKVITMSAGFCTILAIRDSFQVYIEDTALRISGKEEHQKVMISIEVYRKLVQLLFSIVFTLVLAKFDMTVIIFILCILAIIEIILNKKMYDKLIEYFDL